MIEFGCGEPPAPTSIFSSVGNFC